MKILTPGMYYGDQKSELNFGEIILSEYDYTAPRTDWHFHENPYFMYVLQGQVFDYNKRIKTNCIPGSLLFHNWQEMHYNALHTQNARGFHIEFPKKWVNNQRIEAAIWEGSGEIHHPKAHHILARIYFEFRFRDVFSKPSIELMLLQLCEQTQNKKLQPEKEPSWVRRLRQLLLEDFECMSLPFLSDQLGVHPVHISRAFPKYFASSLGDYLREQRIKRALSYMLNKNDSLTEIANRCGFSDQSHFIRTFRAYMHTTPSAFRKQIL